MTAATRIYNLDIPVDIVAQARLVRAATRAQALRHLAELLINVSVASQEDIIAAMTNGVKVETAGEEAGDA